MTNLSLRSLDIPSLQKFAIGFDSMFDELFRHGATVGNYPPYNVIRTGDETFVIEMAVAGFSEGEINITVDNRALHVSGSKGEQSANWEYIHRGLSSRNFKQTFQLAQHVEVRGATVKNGILTVHLERSVPETLKPKSIPIAYDK